MNRDAHGATSIAVISMIMTTCPHLTMKGIAFLQCSSTFRQNFVDLLASVGIGAVETQTMPEMPIGASLDTHTRQVILIALLGPLRRRRGVRHKAPEDRKGVSATESEEVA